MSPSPTRIWIGVTDNDWFRFLRDEPDLDEVNFWQPSGKRSFRALQPGDLFLFKLHSPHDYIVGGGFFIRYVSFPAPPIRSAASFSASRSSGTAPTGYRPPPTSQGTSSRGRPTPPTQPPPGSSGLRSSTGSRPAPPCSSPRYPAPMWSEPTLVRLRLGQGTFRALTTDNYQRRCAVTGEKALPVLDAAHIRPVGEGGQHRLDNGLLLHTDVHRLFEAGYVTITPDGRFLVSRRLKDDFDNGEPYMPFHGQRIWMPGDPVDRPDQRALEWHAGEVFLR